MRESSDGPRRLLRRDERRAQLIRAAASAFVRSGYSATSLEDVAAEAGVTKVVIYRHFESKRDLYLAVLLDVRARIRAKLEHDGEPRTDSVHQLAVAASENPDGYRLLYRHARYEPEFAEIVNDINVSTAEMTEARLQAHIPDDGRRAWIAALIPTLVVESVLTWLDADQPGSPAELADTIDPVLKQLVTGGR
ncbi:TetR/AcrR family transcriptional regulator [Pseudonocardia sp. TRM90224]|uniref:TetR/AcrR family transcriptional regulator n=1 Tax=Pseudonocardia sp. TRM90224 TaxID=2812678 RepID=UPI001E362F29|nr:TetR/AcrR family transcriptional regulator [Pseudonocardia sp. TRM90224]